MVFSKAEVEQFIEDGFVILRRAFPREMAEDCRRFLWDYIGSWQNCRTDAQAKIAISAGFHEPPFDPVLTPRMSEAFDQIAGRGRWVGSGRHFLQDASGGGQWIQIGYGFWHILLPGFPGPGGWHIDHLNTGHQGLVRLCLFSDIGPDDGGTPMVRGSHKEVARAGGAEVLSGMAPRVGLWKRLKEASLLDPDPRRIVHVTGEAGDVALMHPLLVHGFGPNRGNRIRFACNPLLPLTEPIRLERSDGDYSAIEEAIRRAAWQSREL